jgi:hypothetical protein
MYPSARVRHRAFACGLLALLSCVLMTLAPTASDAKAKRHARGAINQAVHIVELRRGTQATRAFAVGEPVTVVASFASQAKHYRIALDGTTVGGCRSVTGPTVTVDVTAPITPGGHQLQISQFFTSACPPWHGADNDQATFWVARAVASAQSNMTPPKSVFGGGSHPYVRVDGLPGWVGNWSVRWSAGATEQCANTFGNDRPDTNVIGVLETLDYPAAGGYDTACPALSAANSGQWKLRLTLGSLDVTLDAFTLDATAPDAPAINSGPNGLVATTAATFGYTPAEDGGALWCSLDAGAWALCGSRTTKSYAVGQGGHTFSVRQVDDLGNVGAAASRTWTADTVAPGAPGIVGGPSEGAVVPSGTSTFAFSPDEEGDTLECKVDDGEFAPCSSSHDVDGLDDGHHTISVRETDAAGNTGPEATRDWSIDTAEPGAPQITKGPGHPTSDTEADFDFDPAEDGGTVHCVIDPEEDSDPIAFDARRTPISNGDDCSVVYEGLPDGPHTFVVWQVDEAGNAGPQSRYSWTVDTRAPLAPTITDGPQGTVKTAKAALAFVGAEQGGVLQCRLERTGAFLPCTSVKGYDGLVDGGHVFEVRQVDAAGNISPTADRAWTVDTTIELAKAPDVAGSQTAGALEPLGLTARFGSTGNCISPRKVSSLALMYTLTRDATVDIKIVRRLGGRTWHSCPDGNVKGSDKDRFTPVTSFTELGRGGSNGVTLDTRTGARAAKSSKSARRFRASSPAGRHRVRMASLLGDGTLTPGTYQVWLSAVDSEGTRTAGVALKFYVLR